MGEHPHYTSLLTKDFFEHYYIEKRMSYPKIREMLLKQGHNIHVGTLYNYAKKVGIGRDASEAKRNREKDPLNYNISYMTEDIIEFIDGFLLGDGSLHSSKRSPIQSARMTCGLEHEEFCRYFMSFVDCYQPCVTQYKCNSMKSGFVWTGRTKFHPDLYKQWIRWYPKRDDSKRKKQIPKDVRITPTSVMLWFLGDGTLSQQNDTAVVKLSTDGFYPEGVEFLTEKLRDKGIQCHRNNSNRIQIKAKGIPAFFDFIGRESPIKCYSYKFDLPDWRFEAKRMREVSEELGIEYQQLAYLVKIGKIGCYRASEKGKPRFLTEHIEEIKKHFGV